MTITIKKPLSAAGLARHLSRILRENGFERADTSDRNHWTEGFVVHRVGYSKTVHVDYYVIGVIGQPDMDRQRAWNKVSQMRELLFELGYDVSSKPHSIYIECQQS